MATSTIMKTFPYVQYLAAPSEKSSFNLSIKNSARYLVIGTSSATARCFASIVISYSSGAVYTLDLKLGSDVTLNTSTNNRLQINTGSSTTMNVMIISLNDTKPNETYT